MTLEMQPQFTELTLSRRRWFRFSVRSLLVFTTLVACFLGWIAKERSQAWSERQIGKKLQEQGCSLKFLGRFDSLELSDKRKPQGWWRDLARKVLGERIVSIYMSRPNVESLSLLTGFSSL